MRSAGKPGQGASSILGIWPPMVGTTLRDCVARARGWSPRRSPRRCPAWPKREPGHAQVPRRRVLDLELPVGCRGQPDEGAHLHVVAADAELGRRRACFTPSMRRMLDPIPSIRGAHGHEHPAEVLDVRLRGRVFDDGSPLGQHRRHDGVLRGRDRGLVQEDLRALELVRGQGEEGAGLHAGPQLHERQKVGVQGPAADHVAAGRRKQDPARCAPGAAPRRGWRRGSSAPGAAGPPPVGYPESETGTRWRRASPRSTPGP